jgi:hypothetical protein
MNEVERLQRELDETLSEYLKIPSHLLLLDRWAVLHSRVTMIRGRLEALARVQGCRSGSSLHAHGGRR